MRPSEVLARHREEVRSVIARFGACNPQLFGSVARSDDTEASDIDILVDLPDGTSYYQVFRIEDALSDLLGCRVDVHVPGRSESRFARRIKADLTPL